MASEEALSTQSNQEADLPHAEPPADSSEQNESPCVPSGSEQQAVGTNVRDPVVTADENVPRPLAELCRDQTKQGEYVQISQAHDDLCSTLLNGSVLDPTLSLSDTVVPPSSEHVEESEQESCISKPPETCSGEETSSQWVDVLGNGQLMKKTIRAGEGPSTRPALECSVRMKVKGYLESGKVVEYPHSFRFIVGDGDYLQAWDLAAGLMEKKEIALVKADSRFAYGESGSKEHDIPPNATITFELQLMEVHSALDYSMATEEELLALLTVKRSRGNDLYQKKDYERALNSYSRGLSMLERYLNEQHLEPSDAIKNMQIGCWNNLAAAAIKVEAHQEALKACQNVLKYEPDNVKALYRCGKVAATLGDYDAAIESFQKAVNLCPEEKAIQTELQHVIKKRDKSLEDEKAMYRRMLGTTTPKKPQSPPHKVMPASSDAWGPLPYLAVAASVAAVGIGVAYYFFQRH